jgi:hypothetical protein
MEGEKTEEERKRLRVANGKRRRHSGAQREKNTKRDRQWEREGSGKN